jgi:hypothetical protein
MRGGWVTQLCTFAYVVVWPEIIYEVEYYLEAEELRKSATQSRLSAHTFETVSSVPANLSLDSSGYMGQHGSRRFHGLGIATVHAPDLPTMTEQAAEQARLDRIADKAQREAAEKATTHARRTVPMVTAHPSLNQSHHLLGIDPHIIIDPRRASGKESLFLSAIGSRLDDKGKAMWPRFLRYFNGQCALERIALQDDMKRKDAWGLLGSMSEYMVCVRHW